MWYDDPFVKFKKRKKNRRRRSTGRTPILMVNARMEEKRRDRLNRLGVLVLVLVALAGVGWVFLQGGRLVGRVLFSENARYLVRTFEIASDGNHIPSAFIRETFGLEDGMNLFAVNIRSLARRDRDGAAGPAGRGPADPSGHAEDLGGGTRGDCPRLGTSSRRTR